MRTIFIALKQAHEVEIFKQNPEKILNFVEGLSSKMAKLLDVDIDFFQNIRQRKTSDTKKIKKL